MSSIIKDYYENAGVKPFLIEDKLDKLKKHSDIAAEFEYWIQNKQYRNDVSVEGYTVTDMDSTIRDAISENMNSLDESDVRSACADAMNYDCYRMSSATSMNAELNHITVLEEAHNLLRRTSNEQSAEGSNLLGKSVEMLSNAIAEMRTYGEGFIIADQAPGLMDMSVIRNTNTKIILRLPDQADRELVGRAANLNEDQITELAKLPCGVAAVYQNEWIQPVLCKVDLFAAPEKPFTFDPEDNDLDNYYKTEVEESLLNCIMEKEILRRGNKTDLKALKSKIIKSKLETCVKRDFMEYLEHDGENAIETLRKLIYDFLSAENAIIEAKQCNDIVEWTRTVVDRLSPSLKAYPNKQIDLALALILYEQTVRDASYGSVFCKFTEVYKNEGGVF